MERRTTRFWILSGLAVGSIAGALIRLSTPDSWWNLTFMPWYVMPMTLPSLFLLFVTALILGIDVFTDTANQVLVNGLLSLMTVVVVGAYGASVGRFWARCRSVRSVR